MLILGNIVALVASLIMVYTGTITIRKKFIATQTIYMGLFVISNALLNGISGVIINIVSLVRNALCYKDKLGFIAKFIITFLSVLLVLLFNNYGFIGLLPLISSVVYIWLMTIKDVREFKILLMFTVALWVVYDFAIQSYTSCLFHSLTVVSNAISFFKLKGRKNYKKV